VNPMLNINIKVSCFLIPALLAVTVLLSGGCAGITAAAVDTGSIEAQIRQADLALLRAEGQRDLDGVMKFIAPDAVFQPPGYPPIVGYDAIRQFYETQWFKLPFVEISGRAETIVVGSSGDLAYFDGRSQLVLEISGERTVATGKYLGVWRNIEGQWKLAAISWSANEITD
jgi:ketosteroid isomerase-like protein